MLLRTLATAALTLSIATPSHAQFRGLIDHLKSKVSDEVGRQIDADAANDDDGQTEAAHQSLAITSGFDFTRGARPLVHDSFGATPVGSMPKAWKTNGSGEIVTVASIPGSWLVLQPFATYKLAAPVALPQRFTVEFDLIAAADEVRDLNSIVFGFAKDNSVREYISDAYNGGALNGVDIGYAGGSSVSSSATGYHHAVDIDLRSASNRVMHVAMAVDGDTVRVYLDGDKIGDAKLFDANAIKYFYISAPVSTEHGGKVLFGNFRIDAG